MDKKLWLWQNGDHFWAFEHLYPKVSPGGDPCTLGEPIGYALLKKSYSSDPREPSAIPAPEGAQAVMRQALEALEAYSRWAASMDTEMQAHNAITALRAALAAPAPLATPDWQQIETAPRDGTAILAFWKPVTGAPASHCYGITEFVEGRWRNPEEDDDYYIDPTHWMPLPAAPQTKEPTNG